MSSIDAVVARSRKPGGFSEHRRFTIARKRAIQKLRRFALVDPHLYVLELVQAAIANGAEWIDLAIEQERCALSWVGGRLLERELGALFDFLFASKDRTEIDHLRELALGINAALLFEPARVVVESGDGTLEGTARVVLRPDEDAIEVGRADKPLAGTYVVLEEIKRGALPPAFRSGGDTPREIDFLEQRCLAAPIPLVVNGSPLFGWSSRRTPGLLGYRKVLAFDEGDLYGTIGIEPAFGDPAFQLLTWGVAVAAKARAFPIASKVGGIVCFDRLRKTVDHSGIVEDERLDELWARLDPHVRVLAGRSVDQSVYGVTGIDGRPIEPGELRRLVRERERVVIAPPRTPATSATGKLALEIAGCLAAPLLCATAEQAEAMRLLSGGRLGVVAPDLTAARAGELYAQQPAGPPARPWLASPVEVEAIRGDALAARILAEHGVADERLAARLGGAALIRATAYTPDRAPIHDNQLEVRLDTTARTILTVRVASPYPMHVLVVSLPDVDPPTIRGGRLAEEPLARAIAEAMADHAVAVLAGIGARLIAAIGDDAPAHGSLMAHLALRDLASGAVARFRRRADGVTVALDAIAAHHDAVADMQLLRTCEGAAIAPAELAAGTVDTCGLVYGTVPEVPAALDGLDRARVVAGSIADEALLVALFGADGYVRVDRRDVLARHEGVLCRDLAVGLREHPDFPLLVEGVDPTSWPHERQSACVRALAGELAHVWLGERIPAGVDPAVVADVEECRRHARRHLLWLAFGGRAEELAPFVLDLPLVLDTDGVPRAPREVERALGSTAGLWLDYGHSWTGTRLAAAVLGATMPITIPVREPPVGVCVDPFLAQLLVPRAGARLAFDFDLDARAGDEDPALVAEVAIDGAGLRGRIGVPAQPVASPDVAIALPDGRRGAGLWQLARGWGVVGVLRFVDDSSWDAAALERAAGAVRDAAARVLERCIDLVTDPTSPAPTVARTSEALLAYAAQRLGFTARPDGGVDVVVADPLATRILELPLLPSRHGGPIAPWRLVRRFAGLAALGLDDPSARLERELAGDAPAHLLAWVRSTFAADRVVRPATRGIRPTPVPDGRDPASLAHVLERALAELGVPAILVHVWMHPPASVEKLVEGVSTLRIDPRHPLVVRALQADPENIEPIATLLLALRAHLTDEAGPEGYAAERQFQVRLAEALARGELFAPG